MAAETFQITVREDGSRVVSQNLEGIGNSSKQAVTGVESLKSALGGMAALLAVDKIISWTDAWQTAANRILAFTQSASQAAAVQNQLYQASRDTRTGFDDMTNIYGKLVQQAGALGMSQQQVIDTTKLLGQAATAQGRSMGDASAAVNAITMSMQKGQMSGMAFRSLMRDFPIVMQAAAQGAGFARDNVANYVKQVSDAQNPTRQFLDDLKAGAPVIGEAFNKTVPTVRQVFGDFTDAVEKFFGEIDKAAGITATFKAIEEAVVNNLAVIMSAITGVGILIFINSLISAIRLLGVAVLTNPLTALIAGLAAVATYAMAARDAFKLSADEAVTAGDVLQAFGQNLTEALTAAPDVIDQSISDAADRINASLDNTTGKVQESTGIWASLHQKYFSDLESGWAGMLVAAGRTFDAVVGFARGMWTEFTVIVEGIIGTIAGAVLAATNLILGAVEKTVNIGIDALNKFKGAASQMGHIDLTGGSIQTGNFLDFYKKLGTTASGAFDAGFKAQGGMGEKFMSSVVDTARKISQTSHQKTSGAGLGAAPPGAPPLKDDNGAAQRLNEQLMNQLMGLLKTIAPVTGAIMEQAKAEQLLKDLQDRHLITIGQYNQYMDALHKHYADIISPLQVVAREHDKLMTSLTMTSDQQAVYNKVRAETQKLEKDGIVVSAQVVDYLNQIYTAEQRAQQQFAARNQLLSESVKPMTDYVTRLQEMNRLLQNPGSGFTQGMAASTLMKDNPDLLKGTSVEIDAVRQKYEDLYTRIAQLVKAGSITEAQAATLRTQQNNQYIKELNAIQLAAANKRLETDTASWGDVTKVALSKVTNGYDNLKKSTADALGAFEDSMTTGFGDAIGKAVTGTESLRDALYQVAQGALQQLVSAMVKVGIQSALNMAQNSAETSQAVAGAGIRAAAVTSAQAAVTASGTAALGVQTAESTGAAATTASAWMPAAMVASIGSFGTAALMAVGGILAVFGLKSLLGFRDGGFTGMTGLNDVAGVVHGQEFVVNAAGTAANRPLLEAMNSGATFNPPPSGAAQGGQVGGGNVNVSIVNHGTSKAFDVQQLSPSDVRIIAKDEARNMLNSPAGDQMVARHLSTSTSKTSRALGNFTTATRNFK
jgi:tape measure domain-containing protein